MDLQSLKRDTAAIDGGQWVDDIPGMGNIRLKVRGLSSPQVVAYRARLERAVPKQQRNRDGSVKTAKAMEIMGQLLADKILLDWEGLEDGGEPMPYSHEAATAILTNPDFLPFADAVTWAAQVVDRGIDAEEIEGN